jgi:anti-sigma factor RsiW
MAWLRTGIVCRKAADYLEDALPPRDRSRLEAHLAGCPHCTEYLRQIQITISAAGQAGPHPLPPGACNELAALYPRWRSSQHQPS